jgi:hypothetical protein
LKQVISNLVCSLQQLDLDAVVEPAVSRDTE